MLTLKDVPLNTLVGDGGVYIKAATNIRHWFDPTNPDFQRAACFAFTTVDCEFTWQLSNVCSALKPYIKEFISPLLKYDWGITKIDFERNEISWHIKTTQDIKKQLTFGTIVRYLIEYPTFVIQWAKYLDFMSPDEAYLTCSHVHANTAPRYSGHVFTPTLENLVALKGFTFDTYLDKLNKNPQSMFDTLYETQFLKRPVYAARLQYSILKQHYICFTPESYNLLAKLQPLDSPEKINEFKACITKGQKPTHEIIDLSTF